MKISKTLFVTLMALGLIGPRGYADENDESSASATKRSFHGDIEVGAVVNTGNTETASFKTAANVEQDFKDWRTEYIINAFYQRAQFDDEAGETEQETTEQQIFLSYQGNYKLTDPAESFFLFGSFNDDRFNGYQYQMKVATGYGKRFYDTAISTLDAELGPGYVWNELDQGGRRQGTIVRGALRYEHELTVATRFRTELITDISFSGETSTSRSESAFVAQINGHLAMKLSFVVEYTSKPEVQRRKTDTETAITVVYSF